jgi:Gpi18-like mannosyltransferase
MAAKELPGGYVPPRAGTAGRSALLALGGLTALWLHILAWPVTTPDMGTYLLPWYDHIADRGPIGAFAEPFSNYTPAYLYLLAFVSLFDGWASPFTLIKLLSVAGTGALALSVHYLLAAAGAPRRIEAALFVFLIPSAIINAPFFGQCDAMWVAPCLMATAEAMRRRTARMLVWCGIAFAFKAQAAFFAPFVFAVLLQQRAPLWQWLIPPAVYLASVMPAWLAGWPLGDLLAVYLAQATTFDVAGNLANPWVAARAWLPDGGRGLFWIGYAAAGTAAIFYVARFRHRTWTPAQMLAAATLSALILPWLLPKMHERYFFLADILAFAFAVTARDRDSVNIALAVQLASMMALFSYTVNWPLPAILGGAVAAVALAGLLAWMRSEAVRPA